MNRRTLLLMVAVSLSASVSQAQLLDAEYSFFEPISGFDDVITDTGEGYYFHFDRIYWTAHTERPTVGSPTAIIRHLEIWGPGAPASNRLPLDRNGDTIEDSPIPSSVNPITRPILRNGLQQLFPRAAFDMGNRFEIGHRSGGEEWSMTLIPRYDITQDQSYGIGFTGQDNTAVGTFENSNQDNGTIPENEDIDDTNDITLQLQPASPLGSVVILFEYDPGFMDGFLDLRDGARAGTPPGDVLEDDTLGDFFLDGDGFADDINFNGVHGPDGTPTPTPGAENFAIDFGDLVELPTSFQRVDVRSTLETVSFEMMHGKSLRHLRSGVGMTFLYGLRYTRFKDEFFVAAHGGVLGESSWDTEIRNNLFGPQLGARWTKQCGRWGYSVDGRAFISLNMEDWEQDVKIGEDLIPSQHNHPLYFSQTVATHGQRKYEFAPMGELRATANYQLTSGFSVSLGFNGMYVDGVRRASTHIKYRLPDMGFIDGRREDILLLGANLGLTLRH